MIRCKAMKLIIRICIVLVVLWSGSPVVASGDFGWMEDFNIRAEASPSDFRARLEARFKVGAVEISAVFGHVHDPADAYILFRLGEMANLPMERVIERYEAEKGKGWGVLAKSLGIKPGSSEFHDLKQRQDLYDDMGGNSGKDKDKGKSKGKGKKK